MQDSESFFNVCNAYFSDTVMLPLFIIAVIIIWKTWNTEKKRMFIIAIVVSVLLVFNGVAYYVISKLGEGATYYRFLWICPIALLVAGALSKVLVNVKKKSCYMIVLMLIVLCFGFSSKPVTNWVNIPKNVYQINDEVIEVADAIMELTGGEQTLIIDNNNLSNEMRQYNARIGYPGELALELNDVLYLEDISTTGRKMIYYLKENNPEYVVLDKKKTLACRLLETAGAEYISETDNYYIYQTDYNRLVEDEADLTLMQERIGTVCNMEYIQTDKGNEWKGFVYISDFGTGKTEEFYQTIADVINESESQFVIINSRFGDASEWYLEQKAMLDNLEIPYYCNNQEFQVIETGEVDICLIDNYEGVSDETIKKFRELKNERSSFILVLTKDIAETDAFYSEAMAEDNGVIAILSAKKGYSRKDILEGRMWQYAIGTEGKGFFTILRTKGLETQ